MASAAAGIVREKASFVDASAMSRARDAAVRAAFAECPLRAKDRDRGEPRGSAPPTPPYVRVRIRRFEKLR